MTSLKESADVLFWMTYTTSCLKLYNWWARFMSWPAGSSGSLEIVDCMLPWLNMVTRDFWSAFYWNTESLSLCDFGALTSFSLLFCSSSKAFIDLISYSLFSEFLPLRMSALGVVLERSCPRPLFWGENSLFMLLILSMLSASRAKFYLNHLFAPLLIFIDASGESNLPPVLA